MLNSFLISVLLLIISCGTETGNPFLDGEPSGGNDSQNGLITLSEQVLNSSCEKLVNCYSSVLTKENCLTGLKLQVNFDTEFGLTDGVFSDFQAIIEAEAEEVLVASGPKVNQCRQDIENLLCSDNEVTSAFDTNFPSIFSSSYNLIPTGAGSCNDIFN